MHSAPLDSVVAVAAAVAAVAVGAAAVASAGPTLADAAHGCQYFHEKNLFPATFN